MSNVFLNNEVFYPNDLTIEEIKYLKGWKLQVAAFHFGDNKTDCVLNDFGYSISLDTKKNEIFLVSCNRKHVSPILVELEKWDYESLLKEYHINTISILKNEIEKKVVQNFENKEKEINNNEIIKFKNE
jgi:hypothetical protein